MTIDKVISVIGSVIRLKCETSEIHMETRLADLGVDSLNTVTIIFELEEEFNIEIPNEILSNIKTIGDIVREIDDCLATTRL